MAPHRFKCSKCGEWHEGFPDMGYSMPFYANEISEAERAKRVFLTSDLCVIDDKDFFVRCMLRLPIKGTDTDFGWGVWSTLSEANFVRYQKHYDDDMSGWEPMFGYLSNRLPEYPDTLSLKLSVQPQAKGLRPNLALEPTAHPLAVDQREGMTLERAIKIAEPFLHP